MSIPLDSRLLGKVLGRLMKGGAAMSKGLNPDTEAKALSNMLEKAGVAKKPLRNLPTTAGGLGVKKGIVRKPLQDQMGEEALLRLRVKEARGLEPSQLARELVKQGKRKNDLPGRPILSAGARKEAEDAIERNFDDGFDTSDENRLSALRNTEVRQKIEAHRAAKGEEPSAEMKARWRQEWNEQAKEEGRVGYRVLGGPESKKLKESHEGVRHLETEKEKADAAFLAYQGLPKSAAREAAYQGKVEAGRELGGEAEKFRNVAYSIMKNSSNPEMELDRFLRKYPAAARALQSRAVSTINKAGAVGEENAALRAKAVDPKARKGVRFAAKIALGDSLNMKTPKKGLSDNDRSTIALRMRNKAAKLTDGQPVSLGPAKKFTGSEQGEFVRAMTDKLRDPLKTTPRPEAGGSPTQRLREAMNFRRAKPLAPRGKVAPDKQGMPSSFFQPEGLPNPRPYRDRKTGKEYPGLSEQGKAVVQARKGSGRAFSQAGPEEGMARSLGQVIEKIKRANPDKVAEVAELTKMVEGLRGGVVDPRIAEILEALGY